MLRCSECQQADVVAIGIQHTAPQSYGGRFSNVSSQPTIYATSSFQLRDLIGSFQDSQFSNVPRKRVVVDIGDTMNNTAGD